LLILLIAVLHLQYLKIIDGLYATARSGLGAAAAAPAAVSLISGEMDDEPVSFKHNSREWR
jgi:hypothetical protein